MAVITSVNKVQATGPQTTLAVPIGANDDGDLIVIAYQKFGSATMSAPGFTLVGNANNGNAHAGFLYKKNSGGTTSSPVTITLSASGYFGAQSYVIKGAASSPIGATASSNNGGAATKYLSAATLTTTAANSLILHSTGVTTSPSAQPTLSTFNVLGVCESGNNAGNSGADFVATSGATSPSFNFGKSTNDAIVDSAIEIKSDGTSIPLCATPGRSVIEYNGGFGTLPTWKTPNDAGIGISSIAGVNMGSQAISLSYGRLAGEPFNVSRLYFATTAVNEWQGGFETVSANLSGKVICVPWSRDRNSTDRLGANGVIFVLVDSSNNWVAYQLRSLADGFNANQRYVKYIKHGVTTALASGGPGSFDITSIAHIGFFSQGTTATSGGELYLGCGTVWAESSPTVFTGGSADRPLCVEYIARHLSSAGQWPQIGAIQGTKQYLAGISHQIGDGTTKTTFKLTGQSFAFRNVDTDWALGTSAVGLTVKASASCTMDMSSSAVVGESLQNFTIDAASSGSATYNLTGASFIKLNWAANTGIDYSGASFSNCNLVELGNGTVSNVLIAAPEGTTSATVSATGGVLDGCSISATKASGSTDYHLTLGTSVTDITLTDVDFTGTPNTDKVHVLKTSGTVTLNLNGTTSLFASDVTSEGATVSIVSTPVYQTVLISNAVAGTRIQIYDTTSDTELYNGTPTFPYTWTDSFVASSSRAIRLRASYVSGATAKGFIEADIGTCGITGSTAAVSYLVNQFDDDVYIANGISGSTVTGVTFTDATTDLININVVSNTITWPQIYAAFVYWISTASGIADDIAYIKAKDTANYTLTHMKLKNTSSPSAPLVVSGGYGIDSSTLTTLPLVDTSGGTLIFAPDHVVAFQTSGTYAITGDISTVLSAIGDVPADTLAAAALTPICADIRKVNNLAVSGSGTEADPWGP